MNTKILVVSILTMLLLITVASACHYDDIEEDDIKEDDIEEDDIEEDEPPVSIVTKSGAKHSNSMSSPALGLNWQGSVIGDEIPMLYTWAEKGNKYIHHTTDYYPLPGTHTSSVIITPSRIAGEPLVQTGYWNTFRGQRTLLWKSNS